ncbi:MAG: hypothetical protein D6690_01650 [Nitrospirae bacterium]|nr:MAG: hypothetical protein D6690_01650 [Nitrospirota bacterium]
MQIAKHYRRLSHIMQCYADEPIGKLLPRARILPLDDCQIGVESIVSGRPAFQFIWSRRTLTKIQKEACRVLADWQQRHCLVAPLDEKLFIQHIQKPLAELQAALHNRGKAALFDRYLRVLKSKLLNQTIPLVPVHGDFWLNNVLWDEKDDRIRGILDWDESMDQGLPLLDVFHLLYWRTSSLYELHSRWVLFLSLNKRFPGYRGRLIREYCTRLSLEKDLIPWLFVRYWLGEASKKIEGLFESKETLAAFAYLDDLINEYQ